MFRHVSTMFMTIVLFLVSILLAAAFGFTLGACAHSQFRMDKVCEDYCQHIVDCNDNTNFNTCVNDCLDNVNGCDSDEDTEATLDEVEQVFGKDIARLVDGVTKLSRL